MTIAVEHARQAELVQAMRYALRRKPLRRYSIYTSFVDEQVGLQVIKAASGGCSLGKSTDELKRFTFEYCHRLAIKMTQHATPKVVYQPSVATELFGAEDEWAPFFDRSKPLCKAVFDASGLEVKGNAYAFMHKTLQEFNVAQAVVASVEKAVRATMMTPKQLVDAVARKGSTDTASKRE